MKHTKGPWYLVGPCLYAGTLKHPKLLATLRPPTRVSEPTKITSVIKEEFVGNGFLIAAAPEMLEALKAARAALSAEISRQPGHWGITNALDLVDSVLLKAQGES